MILGFVIGLFTGNLLYHGCIHNDWTKGIIVGTIAAMIGGILITIFHIN
jgi:uncharacterized membrane protein YeaQ/YmgE (transglycosylase-associated protein family)